MEATDQKRYHICGREINFWSIQQNVFNTIVS